MASFPNLPGIVVDLQDGNLPTPPVNLGRITLILGTSSTGPADKLFLVTDPANIEIAFSKTGTLVRGMVEALEGGARTMGLYRIGATAAVATGVAHGNAANTGFTITSADQDNLAGTKLKLSFDASKDYLYIYDVDTDTLVYSDDPDNLVNLNRVYVDGSAHSTAVDIGMREDTGLSVTGGLKTIVIVGVDVTDFYSAGDFIEVTTSSTTNKANEGTYRVGTVVFATNTTITFNAKVGAGNWSGWDHTEASAITLRHQIPVTLESLGQDGVHTTEYTVSSIATGTDLDVGATAYAALAVDEVVYFESDDVPAESGLYFVHTKTAASSISLKTTLTGAEITTLTSTSGVVSIGAKVLTGALTDIITSTDMTTPIKAGQRVYINSQYIADSGFYYVKTINATTITVTTTSDTSGTAYSFSDPGVLGNAMEVMDLSAWNYVIGTDGTDLDYRGTYEALQRAYHNLEASNMDFVVPMGVYHNVPNVADDNLLSYSDDALLYLKTEEVNGELVFTWLDATDLALLEGTNPDEAATYHEVSFSYQLARYCYNIDRNEHSCVGFIGVVPPTGYSKAQLSTWYGELPTYDNLGNIIASGSGLLGDKFMVGNLDRSPGFFATDSEELDGATAKDKGNHPIDIGKYLSITATPTVLRNSFIGGLGYVGSFAATYAGMVAAQPLNISMTNQITKPSASAAFALHKSVLNDLVGSNFVMLTYNSAGRTKIVDAPTAATINSDYRRLSTVLIVADIVQSARDIADPAIGKIVNAGIRDALQSQINNMLGQKVGLNLIGKDSIGRLTATRAEEVAGIANLDLLLYPSFELRQIKVSVSLA